MTPSRKCDQCSDQRSVPLWRLWDFLLRNPLPHRSPHKCLRRRFTPIPYSTGTESQVKSGIWSTTAPSTIPPVLSTSTSPTATSFQTSSASTRKLSPKDYPFSTSRTPSISRTPGPCGCSSPGAALGYFYSCSPSSSTSTAPCSRSKPSGCSPGLRTCRGSSSGKFREPGTLDRGTRRR